MKYTVWIRQDNDGKDITRGGATSMHTSESLLEYTKAAAKILNAEPSLVPLFQNGAILEIFDSKRSFMGLQIIGIDNSRKFPETSFFKYCIRRIWGAYKNAHKSRAFGIISVPMDDKGFVDEKNFQEKLTCMFPVKLVYTGVPG